LARSSTVQVGSNLVFGGRTWKVVDLHDRGWTIDVQPHPAGLAPVFVATSASIHRKVREVMRQLYESSEVPQYLDDRVVELLEQGRRAYRQLGLDRGSVVRFDGKCLLALWTGDRELATLERWIDLVRPGFDASPATIGLIVQGSEQDAAQLLRSLPHDVPPTAAELARGIANKESAKYDRYLPEDLLLDECASRRIDVASAQRDLASACKRLD
jgi:ATP-dependent helicase Lhr and Lhr-like helicase